MSSCRAPLSLVISLLCLTRSAAGAQGSPVSIADCADDATPQAVASPILSSLAGIGKALATASGNSSLFDATFLYSVSGKEKEPQVESFSIPKAFGGDSAAITRANSVAESSFAASNFKASMSSLKASAGNLSTDQKLLVLSLIGSRLAQGYSADGKNVTDLEKIYQNALSGSKGGGICGDIHSYLAEAAKALGFESAGLHSALWRKNLNKSGAGGHYVSFFRDPKTGDYYAQNYSQLLRTGKKDLQGAVDVSTRVLGPLTGVTYIQSLPGRWHQYVPQTSRWVSDRLRSTAEIGKDDAAVKLEVTDEGTNFGAGIQREYAPGSFVKGFFVHSDHQAPEGRFQLDAIGVSSASEAVLKLKDSVIDELGFFSRGHLGALNLSAPVLNLKDDRYVEAERSNFFMGAELKGTARINRATGRLEFKAETNDFRSGASGSGSGSDTSGAQVEGKVGVDYQLTEKVTLTGERSWHVVPKSARSFDPSIKTAFDRVGIVIDTRGKEDKAYVTAAGSLYALEGLGKPGATGWHAQIKAAIDSGAVGEFSVVSDLSSVVSNKSGDPYFEAYRNQLASSHSVQWSKWWTKNLQTGAGVKLEDRKHLPLFPASRDVSPTLEDIDRRKVTGFLWLRSVF